MTLNEAVNFVIRCRMYMKNRGFVHRDHTAIIAMLRAKVTPQNSTVSVKSVKNFVDVVYDLDVEFNPNKLQEVFNKMMRNVK